MLGQLLGGWFEAVLFLVGFVVVADQLLKGGGDRAKAKVVAAVQVEAANEEKIGDLPLL